MLAAARGQVVLLNFWASWCEPCIDELPSLERLAQRHAGDGTDHPEVLTENALRDELRRPRRLTYLSHDDVGRVHAGDGLTVEYGDTGD